MRTKLQFAVLVLLAVAIAAVVVMQQLHLNRVQAENAELRDQLAELDSLRQTNSTLADQLKASGNNSKAVESELLRLRSEEGRLRDMEQENSQLKAKQQQLAQQLEGARSALSTAQQEAAAKATPTVLPPNVTQSVDLGSLELQDGVATRLEMAGGTNCVITPTGQADGTVAMQIVMNATGSDGTASEVARWHITSAQGRQCGFSVGDQTFSLAVKLKPAQ